VYLEDKARTPQCKEKTLRKHTQKPWWPQLALYFSYANNQNGEKTHNLHHEPKKKRKKIKNQNKLSQQNGHQTDDKSREESIYRGSRELPEAEASLPFLQLPRSPLISSCDSNRQESKDDATGEGNSITKFSQTWIECNDSEQTREALFLLLLLAWKRNPNRRDETLTTLWLQYNPG